MGNPAKDQPPYSQKPFERRHYNRRETPALSDFTSNAARTNLKVTQDKSTNDKEDFLQIQLKRYLIALQIESHSLIDEFRSAVKEGANLPTEAIFGKTVKDEEAAAEATVGVQQ